MLAGVDQIVWGCRRGKLVIQRVGVFLLWCSNSSLSRCLFYREAMYTKTQNLFVNVTKIDQRRKISQKRRGICQKRSSRRRKLRT